MEKRRAAKILGRWWMKFEKCRKCKSRVYEMGFPYFEQTGIITHTCKNCHDDYCRMLKRRSDVEEIDTYDIYPKWYKLSTYGVGRAVYALIYQTIIRLKLPYNYANSVAWNAQIIARAARADAIAAGATAAEANHAGIEAVMMAYSNGTTSTSVGGADGVY